HQRNLQLLVVFLGLRWVVDRVDDLFQCRPGRFVATQRGLAAPAGGLVLAAFGHGPAVHLDQFVDHARGGGTGAGDHGSADAVRVHGLRAQRGDGASVEVTGDDDAGVLGPERVELLPGLAGGDTEHAGLDAVRGELPSGDAPGGPGTADTVVAAAHRGGLRATSTS